MIKKTFNIILLITFCLLYSQYAESQIISPTGSATRATSQLVYWYDNVELITNIHVTNTNPESGVWIHVQIFRSFDADGSDPATSMDKIICDERDFVDFLTPNDTHVYFTFISTVFPKNQGENETDSGEQTNIDVGDTKGFIVITPVVSESDLSAISFQHMIGYSDLLLRGINAMGRDAVDFTTGEILQDGSVLDGVTGGYVVLQPEELLFNVYSLQEREVQVVGIAFQDVYGVPGLLGYNVSPAVMNWNSFLFDFKEDPTSCGNRVLNCFDDMGLNETFGQYNIELGLDLLCAGTVTPETPFMGTTLFPLGWTRIFISGYEDFVNHIGIFSLDFPFGGTFMYVRGEETEIDPEPPSEECSAEGDEDEDGFADCLDTDCATDESCETGEEECADGMDNDEDGQADCEDLGCDGFAGCEFGEEVSCDDGIDNDADGAVDGDDEDCMVADTGGDGDGGGCVVIGSATTSTSAVNFLILMLPFIGAYGSGRIRKRLDLGA